METLLDSAKFINGALGDFHQLSNTEKTIGKLKKGDTHWAVHVMKTICFTSALGAIFFPYAFSITLLSAFSWYWIRDLSLLKSLDGYLQQISPVIKQMNEYIKSQQQYLTKELQITERITNENQKFTLEVDRMEKSEMQFQKSEKEINKKLLQQNQMMKKQLEKLEEIEKRAEISTQQLDKEKEITKNLQIQNEQLQKTVENMKSENERLEKNRNVLLQEVQDMGETIKTLSSIETKIHQELQTIPGEIDRFQMVITQIENGTGKIEKSDQKSDQKIADTTDEFLEEQQENIDTLSDVNKSLLQFKNEIINIKIKKIKVIKNAR